MKVLVLGHKGMLGHMVVNYLKEQHIEVETVSHRWPTEEFRKSVVLSNANYLINCIGAIPQKTKAVENLYGINFLLPVFLASNFKGKLIHPSSDGEDRDSDYGLSKLYATEFLLRTLGDRLRVIKCSIIGTELSGNSSLLEWLRASTQVQGYENHFWNGVTNLEWAKHSFGIMNKWESYDTITRLGTACISKFDLLCKIKEAFELDVEITASNGKSDINRCMTSDVSIPSILEQLLELSQFAE